MDNDRKHDATQKRPVTSEATTRDMPASRKPKPAPAARRNQTRDAFGPRYRVIDVLGKGGMGEVYRAYDTELRDQVAIKIVCSGADDSETLARFRREIGLARKVTSTNVLRVYDLAEYEGLRFLTMEYVDGEDLAAMMKRDRHMPLERVLAIFRQVCAGLAAVHAQGVVHRDLKPANVLVDKTGTARVADFGLARSVDDSGVTITGAVLGSPAYMSPEQVKGDPVDERSDIYSLGVMLYELVAGKPPFHGASPHAVMEMRLHKKPPSLREASPTTPTYLEPIVARCLALAPTERYSSVRELLDDLDRNRDVLAPRPRKRRWLAPTIGAVAAAALVAVGAAIAWPRGESHTTSAPTLAPSSAPTGPVTVLILGFENRTADPVFDATLDQLLHRALWRSQRLEAMHGTSLRHLAADLIPDKQVDERLAAKLAARDHRTVISLRGFVVPKGAGFAISATAKATNGQIVFMKTLEAPGLSSVVPVMGRLASALRNAYGEPVNDNERDLTGMSTNLEADHDYSIGNAMSINSDRAGAIEHLQQALAKDPKFALAHLALGIAYQNSNREIEAGEEFRLTLQSLDQMNERDQLYFLSTYYLATTQDFDRAIKEFEKLIAKWPTDPFARGNIALAYMAKGDAKKAVELGAIAVRINPQEMVARLNLAEFELNAGSFDRASSDLRSLVEGSARPPPVAYHYLALASLFTGHRAEAIAIFEQFAKLEPSAGATAKADFAMAEGRLADAKALLESGIAEDRKAKQLDAVEVKQAMLAELLLQRGDRAGARAAAAQVTQKPTSLLAAAIVQLATGDDKRPTAVAAKLSTDVAAIKRTIAKLIEGEALRVRGKPEQAMLAIRDSLQLSDQPIGHFLLARAALDAKRFAEAYSELQVCNARRGQLAIGADDVPTYRNVPAVTYYLAKAQEGLGSPDAPATYAAFLAMLHDPDPKNPLVADARRRARR